MRGEADPNGFAPHVPGAKQDAGKVRAGLFFRDFSRALLEVAKVTTYGANKYSPSGWLSVPDAQARYDDAKARHLLRGYQEEADPESELAHLAHEAWNVLALLELRLRERENAEKA